MEQNNNNQEKLAAWLHLYELDRKLRMGADVTSGSSITDQKERHTPAAGDILLLPPVAHAPPLAIERPVYVWVASLDESTQNRLIVPFSRFDIPATEKEWETSLTPQPCKVLCFWNARKIDATALAQAWLALHMPEDTHCECLAAFQHNTSQEACHRFGPPLVHPLDPRHTYIQEETILLDELTKPLQHGAAGHNEIYYEIKENNSMYLRAAEPPHTEEKDDTVDT